MGLNNILHRTKEWSLDHPNIDFLDIPDDNMDKNSATIKPDNDDKSNDDESLSGILKDGIDETSGTVKGSNSSEEMPKFFSPGLVAAACKDMEGEGQSGEGQGFGRVLCQRHSSGEPQY